jgi:hypothetical protein
MGVAPVVAVKSQKSHWQIVWYISPRRWNQNKPSAAVVHHDGRKGRVALEQVSAIRGQMFRAIWELRALWQQNHQNCPSELYGISPDAAVKTSNQAQPLSTMMVGRGALSWNGRLPAVGGYLGQYGSCTRCGGEITKIALANCMVYHPMQLESEQTERSHCPP